MTLQYVAGRLVDLSPDDPSAPRPTLSEKGGFFGQTSMPLQWRGLFGKKKWSLPPGDQRDRAQDPDWTTRGVTYPVVGLNKKYHAQQMADRRQEVYLRNNGLGIAITPDPVPILLVVGGLALLWGFTR